MQDSELIPEFKKLEFTPGSLLVVRVEVCTSPAIVVQLMREYELLLKEATGLPIRVLPYFGDDLADINSISEEDMKCMGWVRDTWSKEHDRDSSRDDSANQNENGD